MEYKNKKRKGFTLIELLIIVAIVGLLASIILVSWSILAQNKAAISGYKTSMDSLRAGIEICAGNGGTVWTGVKKNTHICDPISGSNYPEFSSKCGDDPFFCVDPQIGSDWHISTATDASCTVPWSCRGCRLECTVTGCEEIGSCK